MIFDTHAHYEDERFDEDRNELLGSMSVSGVGRIVNVGASVESTEASVKLADQYDFVYAAVGVHPENVERLTEDNMDRLKELAKHPKVLAIGEIGLDYYYEDPKREVQKIWFERQLDVAREVKLPVIIHSRDAAKDTLDIMQAHHAEEIGGVVHCFSYSTEMAKIYLDMGFYIGIGGVVTFKNSKKLKEVVENIPLERIVLETDCPYLTPVPHRGKRNSSAYLPYVVQTIAEIKGITAQEVEDVTWQNALKMYRMAK